MTATKKKLNYRFISMSKIVRDCRKCEHRQNFAVSKLDGSFHKHDSRCAPIGLKNSIKYAVRDGHTCDAFSLKAEV